MSTATRQCSAPPSPALDSNWGSWLCSDYMYAGGCPDGASPIANAATFVGSDACACCTTVAGLSRDAAGVCIDATQG